VIGDLAWSLAYRDKAMQHRALLAANICAMLGVGMFRINPQQPETAMHILERGLVKYPLTSALLLTTGELHSQCGDMVKALQLYQAVCKLDSRNPLPYLHAARTYMQLSQHSNAIAHIQEAIALDPSFVMGYVDLSRAYRMHGQVQLSLQQHEVAIKLARQVSEIRDVLSAQYLALLQNELERKGLCKGAV
jgi:tetratricopeptide (TPR) repeat protein